MQASTLDLDQLAGGLARLADAISRSGGSALYLLLEERMITPGQLKAVLVLSGHAEPVSIGRLAGELSLSMPTVSRLVDALVRRGWVERRIHASDRRTREVSVTAEGRVLLDEIAVARAADSRVFLDRLTAVQRRRLAGLLAELPFAQPDSPVLTAR